MTPETVTDPDLQEVAWDLSHLLEGAGDDPQAAVDSLLADAQTRADAFAAQYAGKVASLDGAGLIAAMKELAEIEETAGRAGTYAHLSFSIDTANPAFGALLQRVEEKGTAIETALLFFHLEWAELDDARAEELLATDGLDFARHHLATARRYRPHLLSEAEEKILTEKALSGRSAWVRLFEEQTAAIAVDMVDGEEPVALEVALSRLFETDRSVRQDTAERVTKALQPGLRTRAYTFNTLLADKMTDDRLRSFPNWLSSRNLSNEASDESVQALIEAVRGRYELPRRWYRLKAQLLGIDKLADYDRMAAVTQDNEKVAWPEAKRLVLDAYDSFSPELGTLSTGSSTRTGSTARCAPASGAARSAPTACRACTRT
jgi:oligoendopeptidase F